RRPPRRPRLRLPSFSPSAELFLRNNSALGGGEGWASGGRGGPWSVGFARIGPDDDRVNLTETRPGLRQIRHTDAWIFGTMLLSACLSLTASFVLSIDAVTLAA